MPFADHDDVVQAFTSNRADRPLAIRVLPRRAGRNDRSGAWFFKKVRHACDGGL